MQDQTQPAGLPPEDAFTILTPLGELVATFPEDGGVEYAGPAEALEYLRDALRGQVGRLGQSMTPEGIEPVELAEYFRPAAADIAVLPPLSYVVDMASTEEEAEEGGSDGARIAPAPEAAPMMDSADMQQGRGLAELRQQLQASTDPLERLEAAAAILGHYQAAAEPTPEDSPGIAKWRDMLAAGQTSEEISAAMKAEGLDVQARTRVWEAIAPRAAPPAPEPPKDPIAKFKSAAGSILGLEQPRIFPSERLFLEQIAGLGNLSKAQKAWLSKIAIRNGVELAYAPRASGPSLAPGIPGKYPTPMGHPPEDFDMPVWDTSRGEWYDQEIETR